MPLRRLPPNQLPWGRGPSGLPQPLGNPQLPWNTLARLAQLWGAGGTATEARKAVKGKKDAPPMDAPPLPGAGLHTTKKRKL